MNKEEMELRLKYYAQFTGMYENELLLIVMLEEQLAQQNRCLCDIYDSLDCISERLEEMDNKLNEIDGNLFEIKNSL